ncbi:uncharacterized protein TRIVIDRAFT_225220 [Trichoderma virens Gv29-8]|uniref:Uncharacterized protein n=1 Tax=Hypocrea virens (strain Gv29-8 / FGSC 10586) TaxID=413071 RepID=G9N2P2_HYPVG|nr:uncharacterized protein TRIVIDRAFT_225220 [Trichoderma virens Gv29-8]EHK19352.1 hypothetical protein TRIVIDRAFT_225220 [Trichoderma virens Gv29-8]UKZ49196.1 hypothetical protein TrVGV298_003439 [Trichoderma virens]
MPEKHNRAMPPMTPPMIAPVLFAEESLLLVLLLPGLVSFAGAAIVDGVVACDDLPEDASVDLDDDENVLIVICVAVDVGAILPAANITQYLEAILTTRLSTLSHLNCPAINATRYGALKSKRPSDPVIQYFFALNLRQNLPLLPQLMGSIVEAIRFLGPAQCVLSIVEGNSPDGTADVLVALRSALENMGVTHYFESSGIDPSKDDRVCTASKQGISTAPGLARHGDK